MIRIYRLASLAFLVTLIAAFSGCGSSADRVINSQIDLMNQLAAAFENDASDETVKAIEKKMQANGEKMEAMNLTTEEQQALVKKHEADLRQATTRLQKAFLSKMSKNMGQPGGFPGFGTPPGFPGLGQ